MQTDPGKQVDPLIASADSILLTARRYADLDVWASVKLWFEYLNKLGKRVTIVIDQASGNHPVGFDEFVGGLDVQTDFTGGNDFIISLSLDNAAVQSFVYDVDQEAGKLNIHVTPKNGTFTPRDVSSKNADLNPDLIISVGAADIEQISEELPEWFAEKTIVNFDNQVTNEHWGEVNMINLKAAALSEMTYRFLAERNFELNPTQATCLYAGLLSATGNFQRGALTPRTLAVAAKLLAADANKQKIVSTLFQSQKVETLKLWGRVMARIKSSEDGQIVWASVPATDFEKTKTEPQNLSGFVEELLPQVPEARLVAISHEAGDQIVVELHSSNLIDQLHFFGVTSERMSLEKLLVTFASNDLLQVEEQVVKEMKRVVGM